MNEKRITEDQPTSDDDGDRKGLDQALPTPYKEPKRSSKQVRVNHKRPTEQTPLSGDVGVLDLELVVSKFRNTIPVPFNDYTANLVCSLVGQRLTLTAIATLPGMPSVTQVKQWENQYPDFKEKLSIAKQARAEGLADTALNVASESEFKTAQSDKIKIDLLMKLAGALDPDSYGNKSQVKSEHHETLTFLIKTGVPDAMGEYKHTKTIEIEKRDPSVVLAEERAKKSIPVEAKE